MHKYFIMFKMDGDDRGIISHDFFDGDTAREAVLKAIDWYGPDFRVLGVMDENFKKYEYEDLAK